MEVAPKKRGPKVGTKYRTAPNSSLEKKQNYRLNQLEIVGKMKVLYKELGYKIADGNESLIFAETDSTFRIFVSRISHSLQFYYLGEDQDAEEHFLKNIETADEVRQLEAKYKETFG